MIPDRYSRQILFPPIGREGQEKLRVSRAVIIGCGALGTSHAATLVRAGIGTVRIVDRDFVEASNLQRQGLFEESDAAATLPKAVAAQRKLAQINSEVAVEGVVADFDSRSAENLVRDFHVILDGTDNFEARYLLNDVAVKLGIPWVYGAVVASYATTLTILPGRGPCLACVFPEAPQGIHETCDTAGIIAPAVQWASAIHVTEALKILVGREVNLHGSLLSADLWHNEFHRVKPKRDPQCRACGARNFTHLDAGAPADTSLCGRDAVQIRGKQPRAFDLAALKVHLEKFGPVRGNDYLLRFNVERYELTIFPDGRAIVKGTGDPAVARGVYARYLGA